MCVLSDALDRFEVEAEADVARAQARLDSIRQTKAALAASGPATLAAPLTAPATPAAPKADERVELVELKAASVDFRIHYKTLWRWQDNDPARFGTVEVGGKLFLDRHLTAAAIRREKFEKLETRLPAISQADLEHEDV